MLKINADDGYYFGLQVFETIAVEDNIPVFPMEHLERLQNALKNLHIQNPETESALTVSRLRKEAFLCPYRHGVLKISVSEQNLLFTVRENTYREEQYRRGFAVQTSPIRRNETSPLVYYKTANYGDNILEKRRAHSCGFDEPVFLNTRGQICEGATSNIFFVKNQTLFTPKVSCGLLNGIMRNYLMKKYPVEETVLYPGQISEFDEIFLTNSLLGIMPVSSWDGHPIRSCSFSQNLRREYLSLCRTLL